MFSLIVLTVVFANRDHGLLTVALFPPPERPLVGPDQDELPPELWLPPELILAGARGLLVARLPRLGL
jgi:hypothetical protein